MTCTNPYCDRGTCRGPRNPRPHACKACAQRTTILTAALIFAARYTRTQ